MDPAARLDRGLAQLGLRLPDAARGQLLDYVTLLARWNRAFNLTAVRDPESMVTRHLLDALTVLPFISGSSLLDVGTGAGLPGLVVAVARPELAVTLLDANAKKTRFCRQAVAELGLANVAVVNRRVETYVPTDPFDAVVSRAFANLDSFYSLCTHLVAAGGRLVAMVGRLGDHWPGVAHPVIVPGLAGERHVVVVEKGRTSTPVNGAPEQGR